MFFMTKMAEETFRVKWKS